MTGFAPPSSAMQSRPSIPGAGSTVGAAAEERAVTVREAVAMVEAALGAHQQTKERVASLLDSRWHLGTLANGTSPATLAAWGLVSIRMVGRLAGALRPEASLVDAEAWFVGKRCGSAGLSSLLGELIDRRAVGTLERLRHDANLADLLPYVLDAHGPGSRASVMRDPLTRRARAAKRAGGVFYTPADVAEYITKQTVLEHGGRAAELRHLDPACGSGVFLRAALAYAEAVTVGAFDRFAFAESCLFGVDIDPLAVQSACFVLLSDVFGSPSMAGMSPWSVWHRLRLNIVVADALTLIAKPGERRLENTRAALRASLSSARLPPAAKSPTPAPGLFWRGHALADVLPEIGDGADVVIGNPPYAAVGLRDDGPMLERFASFAASDHAGKPDLFPLFLEMMWQLARPGRSAAGMVVPLSIAYHGGGQMTGCRRAIVSSGGRWKFAFFDREPHALFGEDVKTRNAIAFRSEGVGLPARGKPAIIETGPLRKWTSRSRAQLFAAINFTVLEDPYITDGIPKLSGQEASHVFAVLERQRARLDSVWIRAFACMPEDACAAASPRVFVASTAYNFLNVFRPHRQLPPARAPWSQNRLHCMEFATERAAACAFAILSSRVVYWLWRTLGDGFHVQRGFLGSVPFALESRSTQDQIALAEAGAALWQSLQSGQIVSVNGGRQTVAYRPHGSEAQRDRIDALLLRTAGIDAGFAETLNLLSA